MTKGQSKGLRFFVYAVLMHVVLFAIIGIGFRFTKETKVTPAPTQIVNAVAVDSQQLKHNSSFLNNLKLIKGHQPGFH